MRVRAAIHVRGAWAELHNAHEDVLEACLALKHPHPWTSRAFRQGHWDGMLRLYKGNRFPAGLTERVATQLAEDGRDVFVNGYRERKPHDWSFIDKRYLPAHGKFRKLWTHQLRAIRRGLKRTRGIIKAPTGSGKTAIIAAIARALFEEFEWNTLILVPKKGLMHQTAEALQRFYGDEIKVGWMGDSERVDGDIIVATGQTMQGFRPRVVRRTKGKRKQRISVPPDKRLREIVKTFQCIIGDECHRASSDTWYDIFMASGAKRRYGFSATPMKNELISDLKLQGATGPVIYSCDTGELIDAGLAAKPKIAMLMADTVSGKSVMRRAEKRARRATHERAMQRWEKTRKGPVPIRSKIKVDQKEIYRYAYQLGVVRNEAHNAAVLRSVQWLVDHKRKPLVLCRLKEHWNILREMFEEAGLPFLAIWGASDKGDRDLAKSAYGSGRTKIVLATTIWDEGEDIPGVDSIVLAEGVRSMTNALQRIGRGMRRDSKDVWVVDIVPTCHTMLTKQAASRADTYEAEGYEVVLVEDWPAHDEELDDDRSLLPFRRWDAALSRGR